MPFLYRGLLRCKECGAAITMEVQKGHHYLRCTRKLGPCKQRFMREEMLNQQIQEALIRVSITQETAAEILAGFDQLIAESHENEAVRREHLKGELTRLDTHRTRLLDAYMEDALSVEEFRSANDDLVLRRQRVEEELQTRAGGAAARTAAVGHKRFSHCDFCCGKRKTSRKAQILQIRWFEPVRAGSSAQMHAARPVDEQARPLVAAAPVAEPDGPAAASDLAGVSAQDREERIKR